MVGLSPFYFLFLYQNYYMRKLLNFLAIIVGLSSITSCETDFSLNGDYEIQPVVFGLLDHTDDVHFIKVTKAFLGDGDNLVYAQNPDSNYFASVSGNVTEYNDDGDATGRVWNLVDTTITNKDTDGIFYGPEQKVHVFYASDLDSTMTYDLFIDINNGAHEVTGRTELIPKFRLSSQLFFPGYKIPFAPNTVDEDSDYTKWDFTVTEGTNASSYNYKYTMRWTEEYLDGSQASFAATRDNGTETQNTPSQPAVQTASFKGIDFYNWVPTVVKADPNVAKRKVDGIDLRVSVAHYEFAQYLAVGEPVTGIAQVQPEFTNLLGARGLFSSRIIYEVLNLVMDGSSMEHLCTGANGKTSDLIFRSTLPEHVGEPFAW